MTKTWNAETLAVRGGFSGDEATRANVVPIYQSNAYLFEDADHASRLFNLEEGGNIYTRIMNPTTDVLEKRIAALEGGVAALAVSSGQAAITLAILNIAKAGDEIVSSTSIYGGTYNLFHTTLPKLGITVKFTDTKDPSQLHDVITEKTKAVFVETIGNPGMEIADLETIAQIAHSHNVPLIVDNTFATPVLCKPLQFGADIVVYSATKFLGGHGNAMGGIIVDGGTFNWDNGKFTELVDPDPSYHGVSYTNTFGPAAYIVKARVQLLRDLGPALSPFNAFLLLQGIETLSLRLERHVENANRVATFLQNHPAVAWVNYPGIEGNEQYEKAQKYFTFGPSSIFTFGVHGGKEAAKDIINSVTLFDHVANVGDARSLIIHPGSTTHQQLTEEQQRVTGVTPDMIRLSIGIENADDLIADLTNALEKRPALI